MKTLAAILLLTVTNLLISTTILGQYYGYKSSSPTFVYDAEVKGNIGDSLSQRVTKIFRNADSNNDGRISVDELKFFQSWLVGTYKYKENSTAFHPDDFLTQGGGDCEDFAIITTCMLNFHGVVAYVAGFGRVTVNKHAVCIVEVTNDNALGYLFYTLQGWGIPSGIYIPVDYETVGGFSTIDRRWKIARISTPVNIYGVYM